ncbi:MAG: glycosyltransferase family 39 protein [Acidimicrobiales bacterium]
MKQHAGRLDRDRFSLFLVGVGVLAGAVLRFATVSDLWLDEALSVNIARLPFGQMFDALRHDGHPPLYYLLLHGWMEVFGEGDRAVRAMSGVIGLASLPLAWFAGRRYGGRGVALSTVALLASSPFAARYATETRMYSLVTFGALAGWLAVQRALERRTALRLGIVAAVAGLLLLSHYWAFYFLAAVMVTLAWGAWRGRLSNDRNGALAVMGAVAAGGLLFVPWLPSFLEQAANTGTPWAAPVRPATMLVTTLTDFGGGPYGEAQLLGAVIGLLALLALVGRVVDRNRMEIDLRTLPGSRPEWAIVAGTTTLAVIAGYASGSAFASRYAAIVLPLLLLLAARGLDLLPRLGLQRLTLVGIVAVGLIAGVKTARTERTQAGEIAAAVAAQAHAGDVVGFCPDQMGPAVSRLLPRRIKGVSYPDATSPEQVDWVDYAARMKVSDPGAFGRRIDRMAGSGAVWLVWSGDYRSVEGKCEAVVQQLQQLRPAARLVVPLGTLFEHGQLWLFEAP